MTEEKLILSTASAWALGDQFENTQAQKNAALREAKIARQDGDLSENSPYQAAKEKFRTMGRIQRRLTREMNELISQGHRLVDPLTWVKQEPATEVELGTVVELEQEGARETVLVAGARDHHLPANGQIIPIPYCSQLGTALLRRRPADTFAANINGHKQC
ncbi:MAG: hypothetical protein JOY96_08130, partial [Verrucomicrobia bacterium]|nr:hypothetical protein [Verrucomicrobiota bacterium]